MLIQFIKEFGNKKPGDKCRMLAHIAANLIRDGFATECAKTPLPFNNEVIHEAETPEELPQEKSPQAKEKAGYETKVIRAKKPTAKKKK